MPYINKQKSGIKKTLLSLVIAGLALLWILPFIWMLSTSFKRAIDIFNYPVEWVPQIWDFSNYTAVWGGAYPFPTYYLNSVVVTVLTVLGGVVVSSLAAYGFARLHFPGRDAIFLLFLAAIMIPTQVTLIPRFILFHWLGMIDSHWALILPGVFNVFCIFLLRQFYLQIPFELSEAARMDGASELQIWYRIITPATKPALVTVVILLFTWTWNDYENPLIFLTSQKLFTIPLGLNHFVDEFGQQYAPMMAASVCSLLPMLLLFIFGQRYFIEGVTTSGLKG